MAKIYGERWETINSIGEGGQAHTFLVRDMKGSGKTQFVLKRLKNLNRIDRFRKEIEAIRSLSHENVLRLIDFDLDAEKPYIVPEYCSGGSLAQVSPFWEKSPILALSIFIQVCKGILDAHNNEIVHRDIKPDNIFLRTKNGPVVVGDFGICYFEEDGTRITLTEEAVGPRFFMAPESEDGRVEDISSLSDTYSLGKLLYWLLSKGKVFSREKHRVLEFDLKGHNPLIPEGWNNIYMEHVNRLLDGMIVNDPIKRVPVKEVIRGARKISRLIEKEYTPINKDIKKPCKYCGYGFYILQAISSTDVSNFGFNIVGTSQWRIYTCEMCGHVQSFRIDFAKMKEWWA